MRNRIFHLVTGAAVALALSASSAYAQKKYDTGASTPKQAAQAIRKIHELN